MMERTIQEASERLTEALLHSDVYERYRKSGEALRSKPGLFEQIMKLREETIDSYHNPEAGDLVESTERIAGLYEELERIPEVAAFLESEEELVRLLEDVNSRVFDSVELFLPGEGK